MDKKTVDALVERAVEARKKSYCPYSGFAVGAALLANRLIIFPVYAYLFGGNIFGMTVQEAFSAFWLAVLLFNVIKTFAVSLLTLLLYKRLSNFLKRWKI